MVTFTMPVPRYSKLYTPFLVAVETEAFTAPFTSSPGFAQTLVPNTVRSAAEINTFFIAYLSSFVSFFIERYKTTGATSKEKV
jgi:hypothetical protein